MKEGEMEMEIILFALMCFFIYSIVRVGFVKHIGKRRIIEFFRESKAELQLMVPIKISSLEYESSTRKPCLRILDS